MMSKDLAEFNLRNMFVIGDAMCAAAVRLGYSEKTPLHHRLFEGVSMALSAYCELIIKNGTLSADEVEKITQEHMRDSLAKVGK